MGKFSKIQVKIKCYTKVSKYENEIFKYDKSVILNYKQKKQKEFLKMSKKQKIGKKIMKKIIKNLNDNLIIHPFYDLNSYQLWNRRDDVIDFIDNYYMDLDLCSDRPVFINYDLDCLIRKLSKICQEW